MEDFTIETKWFGSGIPPANLLAPWQKPLLDTNIMYPDESGKVHYKLNSLGYRDKEWTDDVLNNSIWCVGHSDVFGMGVEEDQTWCRHLQNLSGIDTVNLGIAGASWDTIARTIVCGLKTYRPKNIIIQATTPDRKEFITEKFQQIVLPSLPNNMLPHKNVWADHDNETSQYQIEKNIELIKAVYKDVIIFNIPNRWDLIRQDPAADNQHIGAATHLQVSQYLVQRLKKFEK